MILQELKTKRLDLGRIREGPPKEQALQLKVKRAGQLLLSRERGPVRGKNACQAHSRNWKTREAGRNGARKRVGRCGWTCKKTADRAEPEIGHSEKAHLKDVYAICSNCCLCSISMEQKYQEKLSHGYIKQQRYLNAYGVQTVSLKNNN